MKNRLPMKIKTNSILRSRHIITGAMRAKDGKPADYVLLALKIGVLDTPPHYEFRSPQEVRDLIEALRCAALEIWPHEAF